MQNDYIIFPWDSILIEHDWHTEQTIENNAMVSNDGCINKYIDYALMGFLLYDIIILFLFTRK